MCRPPRLRHPLPAALFTLICNWSTSGKKDIVWRGSNYLWSKSAAVPSVRRGAERSGEPFEFATDILKESERKLLLRNDWKLVTAIRTERRLGRLSRLHPQVKGEFTCAKDQYVRLNTGWFSDRTACYLAAGRPVITQETGFLNITEGKTGFSPSRQWKRS